MQYKILVELYEELNSTSKRLHKTYHIAKTISDTPDDELEPVLLMIQGKLFPAWEDKKIGVASKLVVKAISKTTGISTQNIEREWKKQGDLGDVAKELVGKKRQTSLFPKELKVKYVFNLLRDLAKQGGHGSVESKISMISELLVNASPKEAKYLIRTVLENLRIGIGRGTLRDAILWSVLPEYLEKYDPETVSFNLSDEERKKYNDKSDGLQAAYDLTNDFSEVLKIIRKKGFKALKGIKIEIGKPINVMLFQKAKDIEDAFKIVGKPAAFEFKYDGFRMQIHKSDKTVRMFTRRLEEVTDQFPEVKAWVLEDVNCKDCILDGEAVGYDPKTGKYLPFQKISQRIKRKYNIDEISVKFPIELNLFDVLYFDGKNHLDTPYKERRDILEKKVKQNQRKIVLAKQIITDDIETANSFYAESLKEGEEGLMAKKLDSPYKPGSRVGYGVKIKPIMDPLDLVIVGAEYGEGKRSGWLTSYTLACDDNGELVEIGKVSTGLKELEEEGTSFKEMTELLRPLIEKTKGKYARIKPEIVIEIGYEEIQKSPTYSSGYALRFPRFLRLRTDEKTVDDISTIEDVEELYRIQRGRN